MHAGILPTSAINVSRLVRRRRTIRTAFIEANHTANILAKVDTEHRNPHDPLLQ